MIDIKKAIKELMEKSEGQPITVIRATSTPLPLTQEETDFIDSFMKTESEPKQFIEDIDHEEVKSNEK